MGSKQPGAPFMKRRPLLMLVLNLAMVSGLFAQGTSATLKIRAVLIDGALNQKPVARLAVSVKAATETAVPVSVRTNFDGIAEITVVPGDYDVSTDSIPFEGKEYRWHQLVKTTAAGASLDLSNDNAIVTNASPVAPPQTMHVVDELTSQFSKLKNSVVTVWSE